MKLVHRALVAVLALLWALPSESSAQIFLASKPHPDFAVGPLFVIANVRPDLSVTVNISFSLTLRPGAAHATMEQDLFLLWPAEVAEPQLVRHLLRHLEGEGEVVRRALPPRAHRVRVGDGVERRVDFDGAERRYSFSDRARKGVVSPAFLVSRAWSSYVSTMSSHGCASPRALCRY